MIPNGDSRVDVQRDPIPVFVAMRLDRSLLWSYVDHLVLPPSASTGPHLHREVAKGMNGDGEATVATETAPIHTGDAVPIQLNYVHAFENTGNQPLEFLIVGVSRDNTRREDSVDAQGGRHAGN